MDYNPETEPAPPPCAHPFHVTSLPTPDEGEHRKGCDCEEATYWFNEFHKRGQELDAAERRAEELEAEFGHLRGKPIIYGSEAKRIAAEAEGYREALERIELMYEARATTRLGAIVHRALSSTPQKPPAG